MTRSQRLLLAVLTASGPFVCSGGCMHHEAVSPAASSTPAAPAPATSQPVAVAPANATPTKVPAEPATKPAAAAAAAAAPPANVSPANVTPTAAPMPPAAAPSSPTAAAAWDAVVEGRPVFMRARAEGVQIYECRKTDAGAYAWQLKAPEALLYNDKGRMIGKHYAGPTWELTDGSKATGEKVAAKPQEGTIPWLLLKATPAGNPKGKLAYVKYVERVDATGGTPPAVPADADHAGKEERVPYRATYVFYAGS